MRPATVPPEGGLIPLSIPTIHLRRAGAADLELIAGHRDLMFSASGFGADAVAAAGGPYRDWLAAALSDGSYLGWLAAAEGAIVGSIGLWLLAWPCHPKHPASSVRGYITNMWVEPADRRRGIGRRLVEVATAEAQARGITFMALHATTEGRLLYAAMGWQPSNEMVLNLTATDLDA